MPHAVSMAATGLQALILCGPGSSFPTFTTNPDENPKALLPIANRPMIWYSLEFCYRMGITDITIITPPSAEKALTTALSRNPYLTSLPAPKASVVAPKDLDYNSGTAQILRMPEVRSVVTSDFVVLPCDLVCELGGDKLLQAWMVKSASLADLLNDEHPTNAHSGGLGVWYQTKSETPIKGQETDFIATVPLPEEPAPKDSILPHISKLVLAMPKDSLKDLQEEKDGLPIRHALLRKHPRVRMRTTYRDAHIYIFPRWVMDFVQENEHFDTVSEDVLGWWAKATWQRGLTEKLGVDRIFDEISGRNKPRPGSESPLNDSPSQLRVKPSPRSAHTVVSVTDKKEQRNPLEHMQPQHSADDIPPMMAYIQPAAANAPLIRRVDTAQLLLQTSLQLAKLPSVEEVGSYAAASPYAHARKVAWPEGIKGRANISRPDSLVAENVTVGERAGIKESVVGAGCQIGEGAKLVECLLMDGVVVGKNVKLTKCILGRRCEIKDGCSLTECEVQELLLVEAKTEAKGEKLMSSSGLEATEEEIQEALEMDAGDENSEF